MSHAAVPDTIRPDPPEALCREFRIEGEIAVRAVLRDLMSRHTLVTVYPDGGCDDALVTRITHIDESGVEFDLSGQANCASALGTARFAIGVAFPERIKTQFALGPLTLLGAAQTPVQPSSAGPVCTTLHAPIPAELYRIQRRDAFRVQPPSEDAARCVRHLGPDDEVHYELLDLSAGGLAIRLPAGTPPPAAGEYWRHSRIETEGERVIPCDLLVRRAFEDPPGSGAHRVACAFDAPPSDVLRRIQLYVLDIEKRLLRRNG